MPGGPKECREHAKTCLRMAGNARTERARKTFEQLAEQWLRLANDLEAAASVLKEAGNGGSKPS
jgi:hypothetical protein